MNKQIKRDKKKKKRILKNKQEAQRKQIVKSTNLPIVFPTYCNEEIKELFTFIIKKIRSINGFEKYIKKCQNIKDKHDYLIKPEIKLCDTIYRSLPQDFFNKYIKTFRICYNITITNKIYIFIEKTKVFKIQDSLIIYTHHKTSDNKLICFTKHTLLRAAERLGLTLNSYTEYATIFGILSCHTEDIKVKNKTFLKIWLEFSQPYDTYDFAKQIAEKDINKGLLLFGYCPTITQGNVLITRTIIPPGYCSTPERDWYEKTHGVLKNKEAELFCCYKKVRQANNFQLLKLFHNNGFTQVMEQ